MTVSEYIFDFIQKKGVSTVYMVSGSSAMWLTDALKRNDRLVPVCCQHEQAAAMAADVYGRLNRIPGACLVTIGPGATNAITGVAGAYVDSSPMIVISGQSNSRLLQMQNEKGLRQVGTQSISLNSMVSSITKYFAEVTKAEDIKFHMEKAWHEATEGRKGPVWLDVPIDIQNKQIPKEMKGLESNCADGGFDDIPADKINDLLDCAKKPLILAGNGVINAKAEEELLAFAERNDIPIVTSRAGIGVIYSDHPLFVGRPGSYGDRASHFAIQECDLLFILGSRLAVSTIGYYPDRFGLNAIKVMVDIDDKELSKADVPINIRIRTDVKKFLEAMSGGARKHKEWVAHCVENKKKYPVVLSDYSAEEGINSYYFTQKLSAVAHEKCNVVVDTGSVCNIVSQSWHLKSGQRYIISGGLSCMGFWASAIGAAANGECVIALSGDGSVQMNVQEFATIQYYCLPIKLFVYNNHGYMLIRHNQHNYMNDRFLGVGPDSGVPSVDFCKVAEAYGLKHYRINDKEEIDSILAQVMNDSGPLVCEVNVQEFGIIAPRISSRVMPDGTLKAAEYDDLWPFLDSESK
ncbi:acetolactate synthase-1/2/3 large subunit [Lachnospiraceae bacterium KHCPX20]|nr:acetolactate synthase-1/2/3 large subunit [Lachnospiraceae bacterium KHCPX20]